MIPLDIEEWRTVVIDGEIYEDYEVSDGGKIRSLNYRGHGKIQILKQRKHNGYFKVNLYKDGIMKSYQVNRVVAFTYSDKIPNDNPTEKTQVNHINEDTYDNRVENLEWVSPKENINHGTCIERSAKSRQKRVKCIETNTIYESIGQASRETNVSVGGICNCCKGKLESIKGLHWEYVD